MNIVTVCRKHGELTKEQCSKSIVRGKYYKCLKCQRDHHKKYVDKNPERFKQIIKASKRKNRENIILEQKKYYQSPKGKQKLKARNDRDSKNLTDQYVKRVLMMRSSLQAKDLMPELIELKRIQIKLVRALKERK